MKKIPTYSGTLRSHLLAVPHCISECSGIRIFGRRIKSLVFTTDVTITQIKHVVDIPVIATIISSEMDVAGRVRAGADILNISGAARTPEIVAKIRKDFPDIPIIATGGPTEEDILRTIQAGANAITYTPPSTGELFSVRMHQYRAQFHPE